MQVRGEKDYVSLAKGLITERSPIIGEEQACRDELNCLYDSGIGARVKRKGLEQRGVYSFAGPNSPRFVRRHHWEEHDLFVDVFFESVPRPGGAKYTILRLVQDTAPYAVYTTFEMLNFSTPFDDGKYHVSSNSRFLLVGGGGRVFVLYKQPSNKVDVYYVNLYIRDFKLLPDTLTVSERPTTLTDEHKYNLYNAGWYAERKNASGTLVDPVTEFFSQTPSVYPSNADIAVLGLKANSSGDEVFSKATLVETVNGSTEAPRGHYVYDIRFITRDTTLGSKNDDGVPPSTLVLDQTVTW